MLLAESFLQLDSWDDPEVLVAVVLFIVGTGITLLLRSRDKPTKTFDYRVASDAPILTHRPEDKDLKVTYLGDEIDNPRLVRIQFANSGTKLIRASEVLEPYLLTVYDAWLVSATMVHSSRPNLAALEATCEPGKHGVRLTLATLNAGDNFTLQLIVDSETPVKTSLSGCVEEETRPPGWLTTGRHKRLLTQEIWWGSFGSAIAIALGVWNLLAERDTWIAIAFIVIGLVGGLTSLSAFVERWRRVKRGWPGAQVTTGDI